MVITIEEVGRRIQAESRGELPDGVTISEETPIADLGLSSLEMSEVVFGLEEDYEVEFDVAAAADSVTIGDLLAVANRALAERGGDATVTQAPASATEPALVHESTVHAS